MNAAILAVTGTSTSADPSIGSSLLHMVLALAAVIAAILVVNKVLQAIRGGTRSPRTRWGGQASSLEILARQSLGKGVLVAVVRYGGREVLVGVAGQHISFFEEAAAGRVAPAVIDEPVAPPDSAAVRPTEAEREHAPTRDTTLSELEAMLRRSALAPAPAHPAGSATTSLLERLRTVTERR